MGSIADINDQIKKLSEDTQQVLTDRQRIKQLKKNLQDTRAQLDVPERQGAPHPGSPGHPQHHFQHRQ